MNKIVVAAALMLAAANLVAQSQLEIGVVYYQDGSAFYPLKKSVARVGGRSTIAAQIPGSAASIRLPAGQVPVFKVCGVDPTRYKLYPLKIVGRSRSIDISKVRRLGGADVVLPQEEIPATITAAEPNCYSITSKQPLLDGEYAVSPVDSNDVFDFGIGEPKKK